MWTKLKKSPFVIGMAGALCVLIAVVLVWLAIIVYVRAYHGQQAYEMIAAAQAAQQVVQPPRAAPVQTAPPTPAFTPAPKPAP